MIRVLAARHQPVVLGESITVRLANVHMYCSGVSRPHKSGWWV